MTRMTTALSLLASSALLAVAPVAISAHATPRAVRVAAQPDGVTAGPGGGTPGTSMNFQLVGHDPLFGRGMNAALALYSNFFYIGNRTDRSSTCGTSAPRRPRH